jgi:YfiH family protein
MLKYSLGEKIEAFTTDRTVGRNIPGVIYPHQVHTDRIFAITSDFLALSERERKDALDGIDAIMSDVRDVVMGISTADCIPVIVYDSAHHVAAAIHAGWKGTRLRIVTKAIKEMQHLYGTDPSACTAAIGPGISQESFEVGQEVVDAFVEAGFEMSDYVIMKKKPHIDLKALNKFQLTSMGVKSQNITVSDVDTFTNPDYFSARREQHGDVKCGRILSGFMLK